MRMTNEQTKMILKISSSLNVSLDTNSEFDRDFANKINNAIPIKATVVIIYLNLIHLSHILLTQTLRPMIYH